MHFTNQLVIHEMMILSWNFAVRIQWREMVLDVELKLQFDDLKMRVFFFEKCINEKLKVSFPRGIDNSWNGEYAWENVRRRVHK